MKENSKNLKEVLIENISFLENALITFDYSYQKCVNINIKDDYNPEELESFEALTSRFARISDILTQKVFNSIFSLIRENPKTFIDKCNLAEKFGMIDNAEKLISIRDLRNEIAHEYASIDLNEIFELCLNLTSDLKKAIIKTTRYAKRLLEI